MCRLPAFQYTGTDPVMATLCEYMATSSKWNDDYLETGEAWVPAPVVIGTVESGDELLVYCDLWNFSYYLKKDTLIERGGGANPCLVHMRKRDEGDGYMITQVQETGDGADHIKDFRAFCNGNEEILDKYLNWEVHNAARDAIRKELLQQYVQQNDLSVKYYKDYNRDPVSIF